MSEIIYEETLSQAPHTWHEERPVSALAN